MEPNDVKHEKPTKDVITNSVQNDECRETPLSILNRDLQSKEIKQELIDMNDNIDTTKGEMYQQLVRIECKLEHNRLTEADVSNWLLKERENLEPGITPKVTRSKPQVAKKRTHKLSRLSKSNKKRYKINSDANAQTNSKIVPPSGNDGDIDDNICSKTEGSTSNVVTDNVNTDIPEPNDEPMTNTATTITVTGSNSPEVTEPITEPMTNTATTETVTGLNSTEVTVLITETVQVNNNTEVGTYSDSTIDYEHSEEILKNANTKVTSPKAAHLNGEHSKSESNGEPDLIIRRKRHHKRVKYIKSSASECDSDESTH